MSDRNDSHREDVADALEPGSCKSLVGLAFLVPSGVLFGGVELYTIVAHKHLHSPVLGIIAIIWCAFGGTLLAVVVLRNLFPELDRSRDALLGWSQLPRTKRYLARVDRGEPVVLFGASAVHKLRNLNRISMVVATLVVAGSTYGLIVTDFVPALESRSQGSDLSALALIGVVLVAYVVSRLIRGWVNRDATRRVRSCHQDGSSSFPGNARHRTPEGRV